MTVLHVGWPFAYDTFEAPASPWTAVPWTPWELAMQPTVAGTVGAIATAQAVQVSALAALVRFKAIMVTTQGAQSSAVGAVVRFKATIVTTQPSQLSALAAAVRHRAAIATAQPRQVSALAAVERFRATIVTTQAPQTMAATAQWVIAPPPALPGPSFGSVRYMPFRFPEVRRTVRARIATAQRSQRTRIRVVVSESLFELADLAA